MRADPTMIHVAVLKTKYLDMLLSGEKSIECRLTRNRIDPHGRIRRGERVYFKESSGPFRATAVVDEVIERSDMDETGIEAIRAEFGEAIGAPEAFWTSKKTARFAVLIRFRKVERVYRGPKTPALNGRGWIRLPREEDPYPKCLDTKNPHPPGARAKKTSEAAPKKSGRDKSQRDRGTARA